MDEEKNEGLNYDSDFQFNPTKFYCKKRGGELEFYSEITNEFYCRQCKYAGDGCEDDKVISTIPYQLQ